MGKQKKDPYRMGMGKCIGWSGASTSMAANVIILGYLSFYCTNYLGLSAGLVGSLLLASKIFDGITDIVIGFLIEKTHTKMGKARPYDLGILGVWICTILLFACPASMSTFAKAAWVFAMYTFVNSIFGTMVYGDETIFMSRAITYEEDRKKVVAVQGVVIMVVSMAVAIIFPIAMREIATSTSGWFRLVLICAVPLTLIGLLRFLTCKEINPNVVDQKTEKVSGKEFFAALGRCPDIFCLGGMKILYQISAVLTTTISAYYFTEIVGDVGMSSTVGAMSIIVVPLIAMLPSLTKKFGNIGLMKIGLVIGFCGCMIRQFAGINIPLLMISTALALMGTFALAYLPPAMAVDCMDYAEWKAGGRRVEGPFGSVIGFCNKVGQGLASGIVGLLMERSGFIAHDDSVVVVQPDSAINMIRNLFGVIPAVLMVLMFIVVSLYRVDKKLPEIKPELERMRKEKKK